MLYSLNGGYPGPLPNKITLSDGKVVFIGPDGYSAPELADAGYVLVSNPPTPVGYQVLDWNGTTWTLTDPRTLESAREMKLEELSKCRRDAEENFTYGGVSIKLDSDTQARIDSAISGLERKPAGTTIWWQTGTTFTQFDLPGLEALGVAAFDHVEACFNNSKTITESILAATTIPAIDAISVTVGWP